MKLFTSFCRIFKDDLEMKVPVDLASYIHKRFLDTVDLVCLTWDKTEASLTHVNQVAKEDENAYSPFLPDLGSSLRLHRRFQDKTKSFTRQS
ncbi:unnamed protein product [Caretta caretta]